MRAAIALLGPLCWCSAQEEGGPPSAQNHGGLSSLPGLEKVELGILRQMVFEFLAVNQVFPRHGGINAADPQEVAKSIWEALLLKEGRLWEIVRRVKLVSEDVRDTTELPGLQGMLVWEFVGMRRLVLKHLASSASSAPFSQAAADGRHWDSVQQLAAAVLAESLQGGHANLRDLASLSALGEMGFRELIALMPPVDSASNHTLCSKVSSDLQWALKLLPPGDRFAVALGHYALFWVLWAHLKAEKDGSVQYQGTSSITQAWWLSQQALFVGVREICEVGFNAGHSAWAFLSSARNARMLSFDLMATPYSRACYRVIRAVFPNRHTLVEGPSNLTIPLFVSQNVGHRCDIIHIDGSHDESEAVSDLVHMSAMARAGTVLVMDDVGCTDDHCAGPRLAWESFLQAQAERLQRLGCQVEVGRKWCYALFLH